MRHLSITLLACVALSGAAALAGDQKKRAGKSDASDRAQVMKFLKEHVIGKTVATPKRTDKWDDKKMEVVYEDQTTFNNFTETAKGFSFDMTTVGKATIYDLDKDGKRVLPGRDFSGVVVARYELCERASTKKLTGIARTLSMTVKVPSQEGTVSLVTGVRLADGKLSWQETGPGYLDMLAAKGKYKPGTFDARIMFALVGGKLQTESDLTSFDVDPDTLKRTPTKDKLPPFVSKEIDQR